MGEVDLVARSPFQLTCICRRVNIADSTTMKLARSRSLKVGTDIRFVGAHARPEIASLSQQERISKK
jgi:hypothetical protein